LHLVLSFPFQIRFRFSNKEKYDDVLAVFCFPVGDGSSYLNTFLATTGYILSK